MVSLVGADELIQGGLGGAHFLGNEPDLAGAGLLDHVEILRRDEHKLLVGMLPRHVQERLHALLPRDGVHEHVELIHEAEGTFDDSPEANQKGERGVAAFSPGKQADIGDLRLGISLILLHLDAQLFRVILQLDLSGVPLLVQDAVERSVGLLLHKGAHALPRSLPRFDVVLQVGHGKLDVANRVARIVEDLLVVLVSLPELAQVRVREALLPHQHFLHRQQVLHLLLVVCEGLHRLVPEAPFPQFRETSNLGLAKGVDARCQFGCFSLNRFPHAHLLPLLPWQVPLCICDVPRASALRVCYRV
mmetsp:Transcript_19332/g.73027  ORF Transcript_19332/g.73027 Transcript_19332/m.73027 type:complete len:304 (+) Transcript_19332:2337-3248(+)